MSSWLSAHKTALIYKSFTARAAQISIVPCGFDSAELVPGDRAQARERLGIPQDEFTVLQVGRMVRRKGIETVVRAMAEPVCRDMRLRILGGKSATPDPQRTPEIARLQAVAHECGMSAHVIFEGCKPRQALSDWYAAADVFVTTPWHEPFGITPLEAMACARPVVGSAVGGVKYSIQDGVTGLLVPPTPTARTGYRTGHIARRSRQGASDGRSRGCNARSACSRGKALPLNSALYSNARRVLATSRQETH